MHLFVKASISKIIPCSVHVLNLCDLHCILAAVSKVYTPTHPDHPDLGYLAGSLLTDGGDGAGTPAVHVHISTYKQVK